MARTNWFVDQYFNSQTSNQRAGSSPESAVFRINTMTYQTSDTPAGSPPDQDEDVEKRNKEDNNDDEDDMLDEPTCSICLVPLQNGDIVGDIPCRHLYHKECLKTWCCRKNSCPLCTTPLAFPSATSRNKTTKETDDYDVEQGLSRIDVVESSQSPRDSTTSTTTIREISQEEDAVSDGSRTDGTDMTDEEDME
eukprot:Nitzschia sp. Nitz4//scaffold233_size31335//21611//22192//NITZ4_007953-RA/size31335-processed-gene-0.9-mRNA-1//-1//CDS//3329543385//877//frame0